MFRRVKKYFESHPNAPLIIILAVSVFLRLVVAVWMGNQVEELPGIFDQISYHNLALRILGGHGFTFDQLWWPATPAGEQTAHWSFLYTFYLLAVYTLFGPNPIAGRVLQVVIVGILHPYLVYKIGDKYTGKTTGLVAAAVTAVYFYFIYYSAALMTEPFYITAILATFHFAMRLTEQARSQFISQRVSLSAIIGLMLGCAVLLRQLFLLITPFILFWIGWNVFRQKRKYAWLEIVLPLVIIAAMIVPFTIFNYQRFGEFVLLNTNAGFAFFWGNHPIYGTQFIPILPAEMGTYYELIPPELLPLSEPSLDRALMKIGIGFIFNDPLRYVLLSLSRIPAYFQFWWSADSSTVSNISRVGSFGIFWPFMLYGFIRKLTSSELRRLSSFTWLVFLFVLSYSGMHILTWALIRYRLPVDAIMLLFAAIGLLDLYARLTQRAVPHPADVVKP